MRLCQIDNGGLTNKSADDTAVFNAALSDGILNGFEITYSGGVIYISPGRVLCGGRVVAVDAIEEVLAALVPNGELIISIDLDGNPPVSFVTRPPQTLIQEDTRVTGTKYEVQLATYSISGTYITDLQQTIGESVVNGGNYGNITPSGAIGSESDLPLFTSADGVINTTTVDDARSKLGLIMRGYSIDKNANVDSAAAFQANWANFGNGMGMVYVNGGASYPPSDGFIYCKTNDNYGAAIRLGYANNAPVYYLLYAGEWSVKN